MKLFTKTKTKKTPTSTQDTLSPSRQTVGAATVAQAFTTPASSRSRQITSECIASRAYTLWEQAGRPQGRDLEHWLQAESQLKQVSQAFSA